jgi:hypothetical protein
MAALDILQGEQLKRFRHDPRFENVRQTETITAIDFFLFLRFRFLELVIELDRLAVRGVSIRIGPRFLAR